MQRSIVHSSTSVSNLDSKVSGQFEPSKIVDSFDLEKKLEKLWNFDNER